MSRLRSPAIGLTGRAGAAVLLLLFSAHAGDGLMAALCPPGMSAHQSAPSAPDHSSGSAESLHDAEDHPESDHQSEGMPCPFGMASGVVCGGTATVGSSSAFSTPIPPADLRRVIPDPGDTSGTLLSLKLFRPPRA